MGVVYRARDEVLDREVAIKLIRREAAGDEEVRHRFLREARLAAAINHSGVATLYEAGETEGDGDDDVTQLYLASELVSGCSLEAELQKGPLAVDRVIGIGVQLAEALSAAHQLGIVHRDIKPSNLMMNPDGQLKVLDFGVAKRVDWTGRPGDDAETLTFTARGAVVGTPAYMAPEQVGGGVADARTDIHGAGCVLYQMLSGKSPFGTGPASEVMRRVIVSPPTSLKSLRAEAPRALVDVVEKTLAKNPADRYQSADELAAALREAADSTGVRRSLKNLGKKIPTRAGIVAVLVLALGISIIAGKKLLGTALPFETRDWLLVTDVVNETKFEGFTLALKSALETDLRQSRHVNVFDSGQLHNTLRMMRREASSEIDLETGLEVCRFAGVRALLIPQIHAMGDVYILQASLVDPTTGRTADRVRLTAQGRDQVLLESIDELTRTIRRRLGESLQSIAETDPPLSQYTTSSWEALQLVTMGYREWEGGRVSEAAEFFERALEEDERFAMARGSLGLIYIQFLGREEEGREMLARALEDASEISRREYLLLRAVNRQFVDGDPEEALADYQLVSEFYPDAVSPYNNSGRILQGLGRDEEAVRMFQRAREVDPRNPIPIYSLWTSLNQNLRRPVEAEEAARATVSLLPESQWAHHMLAWTMVSLWRFDEAEEGMRTVLEIDESNSYARSNLAHLLYRREAFDEAVELYRAIRERSHASDRVQTDVFDSLCLGLALQGAERDEEARAVLTEELERFELLSADDDSYREADPGRNACILAALGRSREAWAVARDFESSIGDDPVSLMVLAEIFTLVGEPDRALAAIEKSFEAGYDDPYYILINPPLGGLQGRPEINVLAPR